MHEFESVFSRACTGPFYGLVRVLAWISETGQPIKANYALWIMFCNRNYILTFCCFVTGTLDTHSC